MVRLLPPVDNAHLAEHLRFFQELGVTGLSLDARWRRRAAAPAATTRVVEDVVVTEERPEPDEAVPVSLSLSREQR